MICMCRNIRTGRENYASPEIGTVLEENVMLLQEKDVERNLIILLCIPIYHISKIKKEIRN